MARYIDADKADVEAIHISYMGYSSKADIVEWLEKQPTADVVEVVRCGKCKSFIQSKEDVCAGTCNNPISGLSGRICKSDFCSYGVKKERTDV